MRWLYLSTLALVVGPGCTYATQHTVNVARTVTARELAPASVPLAPAETDLSDQTEVVTKDGRYYPMERGRFQRTETEIIARSDAAGLRSFPIGEVRRVVLAEVVERKGEPESETSVYVSTGTAVMLTIVGLAALTFGGFVWAMSGLK